MKKNKRNSHREELRDFTLDRIRQIESESRNAVFDNIDQKEAFIEEIQSDGEIGTEAKNPQMSNEDSPPPNNCKR